MKYILPAALMLFSIAVLATGGATDMQKATDAQLEMIDRQNQQQAMMGTGSGMKSADKEKEVESKKTKSKIPKTDHNKEEE